MRSNTSKQSDLHIPNLVFSSEWAFLADHLRKAQRFLEDPLRSNGFRVSHFLQAKGLDRLGSNVCLIVRKLIRVSR